MLILTSKDVLSIIGSREAFDAVHAGFLHISAGNIRPFERHQLNAGAERALMGLMPVSDSEKDGPWALKVVLVGRENRALGLDSHQGFLLLADGRTGQPIALIDATSITALRTAAASAVATKALALPLPERIAILGGGTQARSHADAMRRLYPAAELVVWSRSNGVEIAEQLDATYAATVEDAARNAQVICTVTGATTPILDATNVAPGTHINAVGASRPVAREIAGDLVAISKLVVDSRAQAENECGELLLARSEKSIAIDYPIVELQDILSKAHPGRMSVEEITIFKSLGIAAEDLALGKEIIKRARARGIGVEVEIGD
ncbi:ornithine cyclodeaminase family protein [Loktanella sp. DJP18]|uniref:ornithine cyclodeaminase family protein n=1 Tax=Loktanella sp. DJP18 TaxID=3409788 RepID=UPI003BB81362